jgi:hypothetical protein
MAKLKTDHGFRYVKELGGAVRRSTVSSGAKWLVANLRVHGRVLDFGCGFGFDANHFGWEAFDPHYRPDQPTGKFDTIICNHVLNMLTRNSRRNAINAIQCLLTDEGIAWLIVPRNIPRWGKLGLRKRIQNYVRFDMRSEYRDEKLEIYRMTRDAPVIDTTQEIEWRWQGR